MVSGRWHRQSRTRPALYGRERERARLRGLLGDAIADRGSLVLISGEAGIGKTALVEDLIRRAEGLNCLILTGRCYDLTATPPYGPWIEAITDYPVDRPELPAVPEPLQQGTGLEGVASQQQLHDLATAFVLDVAGSVPLLLVLEDLHWSDPASLELLRYLARQIADARVLLVASYRDDEITRRDRLFQLLPSLVRESNASRVELTPLDASALGSLIGSRYALDEDGHARLLVYLIEMSDGNPLFVHELLRGLEHDGVLLRSPDDRWNLGTIDEHAVPPLLLQFIERRFSSLSPDTLRALGMAAVIGATIPLDLWEETSDLSAEMLDLAITEAMEAGVVEDVPGTGGLRFSHALIREALFDGILPTRRRSYHHRVAHALVARSNPDPDWVAFHFHEAGDPNAAEWFIRAGDRAIERHSWVMAADRFEEAVRILEGAPESDADRGWLLYRLGLLLRHADQRRSLAALEEATELSARCGDRLLQALCQMHVGLVHGFIGEFRRGLAEMRAGVDLFDDLSETERIREGQLDAESLQHEFPSMNLHRPLLIMWLAQTGHLTEALEMGDGFLMALEEATTPGREQIAQARCADAYVGIAEAQALLGRPEEARRMFAIAGSGYRHRSYDTLLGTIIAIEIQLVMLPYYADRVAERDEMEAEGMAAHRRAQGVLGRSVPRRARLDMLDGNWQRARETAKDQANAEFRLVMGFRQSSMFDLACILRHQGEIDQAWTQVRRIAPLGPATDPDTISYFHVSLVPLLAAELALDAEDLETARAWLDTQSRWLDWSGAVLGQADMEFVRARYHHVAVDAITARAHAEQALCLASDPQQPLTLIAIHRFLGMLDRLEGRYGDAEQHLRSSLELAEACRVPYERALTLLERAALCIATGQFSAARADLDEAREICARLGARPALDRADELEAALSTARRVRHYPGGLSSREAEVLEQAATGMTNAEIGDALFISPRTVAQHLRSVYNKLGVNSRAAAVARWAELANE